MRKIAQDKRTGAPVEEHINNLARQGTPLREQLRQPPTPPEGTHEFAFDLKLDAALRVRAASFEEAVKILREKLDCADTNFGAWDDGQPILGEVSLNYDPDKEALFEVNGNDDVCVCPGCGAIEGLPEWGTVGDGFDGYCGSCADAREGDEQ